MMQNFLKKLTSRKFLAALAGVATGLAMVFGVDETTISTVAGAVTTVASVVSYIMSEGMVDAAAAGDARAARVIVDLIGDDTDADSRAVQVIMDEPLEEYSE